MCVLLAIVLWVFSECNSAYLANLLCASLIQPLIRCLLTYVVTQSTVVFFAVNVPCPGVLWEFKPMKFIFSQFVFFNFESNLGNWLDCL